MKDEGMAMKNIRLRKLPDRTPAKITITLSADLNKALHDYAEIYRVTYGETETVVELIPFLLEGFLKDDPAFLKARKSLACNAPIEK